MAPLSQWQPTNCYAWSNSTGKTCPILSFQTQASPEKTQPHGLAAILLNFRENLHEIKAPKNRDNFVTVYMTPKQTFGWKARVRTVSHL